MKEQEIRVIMMQDGKVVMDELNPETVILSLTKRVSDVKVNQQTAIIGDPKDVFIASKRLEENVQKTVLEKMKQMLKERPDDPTAQSMLKLMAVLDTLKEKLSSDEDEDPCKDCSVKDECDEFNQPTKGKCA